MREGRLTVESGAARDAAPRRRRALSAGPEASGQVFDIVDLERETQAAASWRWRINAISTLTIAVS
jgi:hypothetical protein